MEKAAVLIFTLSFLVWLVSTAQIYNLNDDLAEDDKFGVFHVETKRKTKPCKKERCCPESKYVFKPTAKSTNSNKTGLCLKKLNCSKDVIKLIRKDINMDLGKKTGPSKTALYAFKGYLYKYKVDAYLRECRRCFKIT